MRTAVGRSVLLALLLFLVLPARGVGAQTGNDAACFIAKANEARAARGYPALTVDPALGSVAILHAQEMARDLSAEPMSDSTLLARAPAGALQLGQNVGSGKSCDELHNQFVGYAPGQNRILDPNFDRIGVGVATVGDTLYVSEVLMQSGQGGKPQPAPTRTATPAPAPTTRPTSSPPASPAPSAPPAATDVSPTPTEEPTETAEPTPPASPSPSETPAAIETRPNRRVPLMVGFALAIVATAALGALAQTRRPKKR